MARYKYSYKPEYPSGYTPSLRDDDLPDRIMKCFDASDDDAAKEKVRTLQQEDWLTHNNRRLHLGEMVEKTVKVFKKTRTVQL